MIPDYDLHQRGLASIATLQPNSERAARVRQRCRTLLERHAQTVAPARTGVSRTEAADVRHTAARKMLVGACCILCVVYVLALVLTTVGLEGMAR